jgi:hypothetical protein
LVREWRRSLRGTVGRGGFRVVHYSLQRDHAHLLVEAADARELACGMKAIGARLARAVRLDEASSGRWFDGWRRALASREPPLELPEVSPPRTWLLSIGWRRHGLIDPAELPGGGGVSTAP